MAPAEPLTATGDDPFTPDELREGWSLFDAEERLEAFRMLPRPSAEDFFLELPSSDQAALVRSLPMAERRSWLRLLAPDDAADTLQSFPPEERAAHVALLDEVTQKD